MAAYVEVFSGEPKKGEIRRTVKYENVPCYMAPDMTIIILEDGVLLLPSERVWEVKYTDAPMEKELDIIQGHIKRSHPDVFGEKRPSNDAEIR